MDSLVLYYEVEFNGIEDMRQIFMPTLIVESIPADAYERLKRRAAAECVSVPEKAMQLLRAMLQDEPGPAPRMPDLIAGEDPTVTAHLPGCSHP